MLITPSSPSAKYLTQALPAELKPCYDLIDRMSYV